MLFPRWEADDFSRDLEQKQGMNNFVFVASLLYDIATLSVLLIIPLELLTILLDDITTLSVLVILALLELLIKLLYNIATLSVLLILDSLELLKYCL